MDGNMLYQLNDTSKLVPQINKELNILRKIYSDFENKVTIREDAVAALRSDRTILSVGLPYYEAKEISKWRNIESISLSADYLIALLVNGHVEKIGETAVNQNKLLGLTNILEIATSPKGFNSFFLNDKGMLLNVDLGYIEDNYSYENWNNLKKIKSDFRYLIGIKNTGEVIATGNNYYDQCEVSNWKNIIDVVLSKNTVGLMTDGTVVATSKANKDDIEIWYKYQEYDVSHWKNIALINSSGNHVVGVTYDGDVFATGNNEDNQCEVSNWENIAFVSCGASHTVGLKADGRVVSTGSNKYGQCEVEAWNEIVFLKCFENFTFGIKQNGSIVYAGRLNTDTSSLSEWKLFNNYTKINDELIFATETRCNIDLLKIELEKSRGLFKIKERERIIRLINEQESIIDSLYK